MVFQDPYASLHPRFTVDQTLREPLSIHRIDDADARIARALSEVGLGPTFRFRYPHQLSGGSASASRSRALIVEPRVLLLDEPTSALDVSVQAEILNLLRRLHRERKLTMIVVSHNLAVIGFLCQRVAVMRHGQIVEQLRIEDVRAGQVARDYTRTLLRDRRVSPSRSGGLTRARRMGVQCSAPRAPVHRCAEQWNLRSARWSIAVRQQLNGNREAFMLQFIETLVVGLIVGLLARAFKPGDDKMGILMTIVLGVVGSLIAGYVGRAAGWYAPGQGAGWIASIVGAIVLLVIVGAVRKRAG
jgi:ABC-type multidrug transport system ATPase subunit/uncharacterized membrane protein YeaQ/YmgE (transglycosylase-associated protein family)